MLKELGTGRGLIRLMSQNHIKKDSSYENLFKTSESVQLDEAIYSIQGDEEHFFQGQKSRWLHQTPPKRLHSAKFDNKYKQHINVSLIYNLIIFHLHKIKMKLARVLFKRETYLEWPQVFQIR